jgi:hypothetical protein
MFRPSTQPRSRSSPRRAASSLVFSAEGGAGRQMANSIHLPCLLRGPRLLRGGGERPGEHTEGRA